MPPVASQPITIHFFRRCLRSLKVLSSLPPSSHFGANEVTSRVNYYHNWCQEQIYDHTELGGSNLINAIKRGEESRAWFPGTKSWVNSSTLISTGNRDLDSIIGGGQALQTSILLEEDRFSDYGQTFGRYWCAEGLSNGHHLIVVDFNDLENEGEGDGDGDNFEAEEFIGSLPLDANLEKLEKKAEEQKKEGTTTNPDTTQLTQLNSLTLLEEGDENDDDDDDDDYAEEKIDTIGDDHLKVAFRYKTGNSNLTPNQASNHNNTPPNSSTYCHSFDLSRKLQKTHLHANPPSLLNLSPSVSFRDLLSHITSKLDSSPPNKLIRLLLLRPPFQAASSAVPLLVNYIRRRNLPAAVFVSVQPNSATSSSSPTSDPHNSTPHLTQLKRSSTIVLRVDSFSGLLTPPPSEYRDYVAIFTITKLSGIGSYTPRRPIALRWGVKRDRRKMHVKMLNLPPEDYSERGGSVGSAVRGGGGKMKKEGGKIRSGMACASTQLEF
ncbi:hypothetical protein TrVE_jg2966 [Triparma verrucosa]|uniref:Elongator complex protein 4 n=1 Tax=Triparma verrucosa TaxID=1606542 RepID=A0A9W7FFR5_9STRA|nr:hypothetical protein TrVE_jg2966 [Triparma verrucosa]